MIQSPLISVSQASSQLTNPLISLAISSSASSSVQWSALISLQPLHYLIWHFVNQLLSTLVSQILGNPTTVTVTRVNLVPTKTDTTTFSTRFAFCFWVMFVSGNISRCQDCSGKIWRGVNGKPLLPPDDLVVQHKQQVLVQVRCLSAFTWSLQCVLSHSLFLHL